MRNTIVLILMEMQWRSFKPWCKMILDHWSFLWSFDIQKLWLEFKWFSEGKICTSYKYHVRNPYLPQYWKSVLLKQLLEFGKWLCRIYHLPNKNATKKNWVNSCTFMVWFFEFFYHVENHRTASKSMKNIPNLFREEGETFQPTFHPMTIDSII